MLYSHNHEQLYIHICMQKNIPLALKGFESVVCERELETEQRLQHIEPPNSSGYHSLSLGGARGVVVIVVGSGHGYTSSNPGRDR